ncbi:MAG: hypothetical protein ACI4FX_03055 [Agathobacter sp.]
MAEERNSGRKAALEVISKINAVDGFDPTAVTKEVASTENPGQKVNFLPLIWKKAWARLVYPLHRCHAQIKEIKDGMVATYAAFYVDNDPGKEAIGEGFAFTPIDAFAADPAKARSEAISLALGSAKSRAYTDAGFGLQFWTDDCIDDLQAAAIQQTVGQTTPMVQVSAPVQSEGEARPIPMAEGTKLSDLVQLSSDQEPASEAPQKSRKTQYEVAKEENEELVRLSGQLPGMVDAMMAAAVGSTEYDAAKKAMAAVQERWEKLSADIASKMAKPSVQANRAADSGYSFFAKTFDQVVGEAKATARTKAAATVENAVQAVPEPVAAQAEPDPAPSEEPSQMTVFMMSVDEARQVVSSCGSYAGKTMGELFDNSVYHQILPRLFERTDNKNERLAIKTLIESAPDLAAYCERNGKTLEV